MRGFWRSGEQDVVCRPEEGGTYQGEEVEEDVHIADVDAEDGCAQKDTDDTAYVEPKSEGGHGEIRDEIGREQKCADDEVHRKSQHSKPLKIQNAQHDGHGGEGETSPVNRIAGDVVRQKGNPRSAGDDDEVHRAIINAAHNAFCFEVFGGVVDGRIDV